MTVVHAADSQLLRAVVVTDSELPMVTTAQVSAVVSAIPAVMKQKFGLDVAVSIDGVMTAAEFYSVYFDTSVEQQVVSEEFNYVSDDSFKFEFGLIKYCRSNKLDELNLFFMEKEAGLIKDCDRFVAYALKNFTPKLELLRKSIKINNNYSSLIRWEKMLGNMSEYDLVITNEILLDTFVNDPVIHTFIRGGLVTGVTCPSNNKYKGAAVISVQPFISREEYFTSQNDGVFTGPELTDIVSYYTCHELGHLIPKHADSYGHFGCIMNPAKGLNYKQWLKEIKTGKCKKNHVLLEHF
jgi:hypothetical protein